MYCLFYMILIFFVTVAIPQEEDVFFNFTLLDRDAYAECIESYLSDEISHYLEGEVTDMKNVFKKVAIVTAGHRVVNWPDDMSEDEIFDDIEEVIEGLQFEDQDYYVEDVPWEAIKAATSDALMDSCSDEVLRRDFKFENEPEVIANILNYILVNWQTSLYNLAQTQEGLSSMSSYANNVLALFRNAFTNYDIEEFRLLIRSVWMHRAVRYFDQRDVDQPYISHYFLNNRTRFFLLRRTYALVYTTEEQILTNTKKYGTWDARNPQVSQENLDRILNIHIADRVSDDNECDIFNVYQKIGMTSVEYYFERHNDQFYRLLFFVQELQARNISTDQAGSLHSGIIPEKIYEMLRNDTVYSEYLLRLRNTYADPNGSQIRRNLASSSRVREEDLIELLITENPTNHISDTNAATTTASSVISTTNKILQRKRKKGSVGANHCGKHFPKRIRPTPSEQEQMETDHYGFVRTNSQLLLVEESSLYLQILQNSFP